VALTLKTLGGLSTGEIARAFLVAEPAMAQRLVRAKRKIHDAAIPYRVPPPELLPERLAGVLATLYLVFNEGYGSTSGPLVRAELCEEAIRLTRVVVGLMPDEPEAAGLLALMLLHHARRAARATPDGALVLLEDQDRSLWDHDAIDQGLALLDEAIALRRPGPYQLQAAIAALHARAPRAEDTDWPQIAALYGRLAQLSPSPVVELNRAVAVAMADGPARALPLVDALGTELDGYHLFHSARADLLRRLDRREEAAAAYRRALELATNPSERAFLERRLSEVAPH
jgi:RNA polymerase sigma-70 factor (ECF subfamily)